MWRIISICNSVSYLFSFRDLAEWLIPWSVLRCTCGQVVTYCPMDNPAGLKDKEKGCSPSSSWMLLNREGSSCCSLAWVKLELFSLLSLNQRIFHLCKSKSKIKRRKCSAFLPDGMNFKVYTHFLGSSSHQETMSPSDLSLSTPHEFMGN